MTSREKVEAQAARLVRKFEDLKRSLLDLGPVAQGTILKRTIRREDPSRPGKTKDYGPYYQWTRKIAGRTRIQNLTAVQSRAFGQAIRENRRLEKIVAEMRSVSLKWLELTTPGVVKRNRKQDDIRTLS